MNTATSQGDVDIAQAAQLFADPTRARVLRALMDGRAVPATVLAAEAGVSPPAASAQLARLREAGLLSVDQSGRHRYYRIASDQVVAILEALAAIAPSEPVRSLRQGTRAAALRRARTCYDHLAGRLGVDVTQALLDRAALVATDGVATAERRGGDRPSTRLPTHPYQLGPAADDVLGSLGVPPEALHGSTAGQRPLLRFCLDWSEQRHHLAGRLGAEVLTALLGAGWIARRPRQRAVRLTESGALELHRRLGITVATHERPG